LGPSIQSQKLKKNEVEGKKGSKPAKLGKFLALKKLKLYFLKILLGFDFKTIVSNFSL